MTKGSKLMWFFLVNGHGKGSHDGACLVIKEVYFAQTTQCSWGKITNVKVVNFLGKELFYHPKSLYTSKWKPLLQLFWHIKSIDVDHVHHICM
jgi:hypothetical protein